MSMRSRVRGERRVGGVAMDLEIGKVLGLPAHALLVHVPIVLAPLTAVGSVSVAFSQRWRQRIGVVVLAFALALAIGTQLAIGSGKALEHAVRKTALVKTHVGQSDLLEPVMLALLASVIALLVLDRIRRHGDDAKIRMASVAVVLATLISAAAAVGLVVRTGHSGARAVWKDSPQLVREVP